MHWAEVSARLIASISAEALVIQAQMHVLSPERGKPIEYVV